MELHFARRTERMQSSAIRELLKVTEQAGMISFGGGLPAPGCFPLDAVKHAFASILDGEQACDALQYSSTEGHLPLRELITKIMKNNGSHASPEEILITNGSQQALDLLAKVFIDPGDVILVENPTYLGALQAFSSYEPWFAAVDCDASGMIPDALETSLKYFKPKLLYLAPTFQNPTGRTMPVERRIQILQLIKEHNILLIEDDPYYELYYSTGKTPPFKALDHSRQIIYLSTFSKTLAPAFRLGWVAADTSIIQRLVQAKQGSDLNSGALVQRAVTTLMSNPLLDSHLDHLRSEYRLRRDAMLDAMKRYFPSEVQWNHPDGGMFLWVELPSHMDSGALLPEAIEQGVTYVPGNAFFAVKAADNCLRLNFSNASLDEIERGIERLGSIFRRHIGKQAVRFMV